MAVNLFMSYPVISTRPDATLAEVEKQLREHRISSVAVVEGDRLVGTITRTDLLRVGRREAGTDRRASLLVLPSRRVADLMTTNVVTVDPEASLAEAARLLLEHRIHRLFVVGAGALVGVFSTRDMMVAIRARRIQTPISELMSSPIFTVSVEDPVSLATDRLDKAGVSGLIVVDGEWPVGIFTQVEALESKDLPRTTPVEDVLCPSLLCLHDLPIHRAAAQVAATRVRRILVVENRQMKGILTGIDFARAIRA